MKTRLDETPYVGRRADGSLHLAESLGPVLDIHCHLALTYVPTGQVDLEVTWPGAVVQHVKGLAVNKSHRIRFQTGN
mgnify:CR=1 FL=1